MQKQKQKKKKKKRGKEIGKYQLRKDLASRVTKAQIIIIIIIKKQRCVKETRHHVYISPSSAKAH